MGACPAVHLVLVIVGIRNDTGVQSGCIDEHCRRTQAAQGYKTLHFVYVQIKSLVVDVGEVSVSRLFQIPFEL